MIDELKPCPFCGGRGKIHEEGTGFFIECGGCFNAETSDYNDKESAIKSWNTRVDNRTDLEKLKGVLGELEIFYVVETYNDYICLRIQEDYNEYLRMCSFIFNKDGVRRNE